MNARCASCGNGGETVVVRLDTGNLVLDTACALHRPQGGLTPGELAAQEIVRCEVFPRACEMSRGELIYWLFSASGRTQVDAWVEALNAIKGDADAFEF